MRFLEVAKTIRSRKRLYVSNVTQLGLGLINTQKKVSNQALGSGTSNHLGHVFCVAVSFLGANRWKNQMGGVWGGGGVLALAESSSNPTSQ